MKSIFRDLKQKLLKFRLSANDALLNESLEGARSMHSNIPPIDSYDWQEVSECIGLLDDDEPVLGVLWNGKAWCVPWKILIQPHIANIDLAGNAVVVMLCSVCSNGSVFLANIEGRQLHFRLTGAYNGVMLAEETGSHSLYTPATGEFLSGPYQGKKLHRLPAYHCKWYEWRDQFPESLLLKPKVAVEAKPHFDQISPTSCSMGKRVRTTALKRDKRLPANQLVLGVISGVMAKAYDLEFLTQQGGIYRDVLDNQELIAVNKPGSWLAIAFSPVIEGRELSFSLTDEGLVDNETSSQWDFGGQCVKGEFYGKNLKYIPSGIEHWYSWYTFHSDTLLASLD